MPAELLQLVKNIPQLSEVPDVELQWLIDKSECKSFEQGEFLFKKGDPIDTMSIILSGSFSIKVEQNGNYRFISKLAKTGNLPYSREKSASGMAEANELSQVNILLRVER